jgi:deoxyribonuclease V
MVRRRAPERNRSPRPVRLPPGARDSRPIIAAIAVNAARYARPAAPDARDPIALNRPLRHRWTLTPREAIALQKRIADRVVREDDFGDVTSVAGVDVGFEEHGEVARAAVALLAFPSLELLDWAVAREPTRFPYVPGLLSFREIPVVRAALKKLHRRPDLVLVDGQGLAHPRRLGIACHLGLVTGLPTIGVAKSLLVGEHRAPAKRRGAWTPLLHREETVGAALRTREGVAPVYVSIGHRVSLESAVRFVLACGSGYRLPETTRWAHRLASGPTVDHGESPHLPRGRLRRVRAARTSAR